MLVSSNFIFLHVPRTGGTWVGKVLSDGGLKDSFQYIGGHAAWNKLESIPIFCFVRNPLSWYASYWCRRVSLGWTGSAMDIGTKDDNFNNWVLKALESEGAYCTTQYNMYTKYTTYVGKYENLLDDLIHMLQISNSKYDEDFIRNYPPMNCSDFATHNAIYDKGVANEVMKKRKRNYGKI